MKKRTKAQLKKAIAAGMSARDELRAIEDAEKTKANAALVGKCFKYRNFFSCPQGDEDYWWLYRKVISIDGDFAKEFRFQTDKNGRIEFEVATTHISNLSTEIPEHEFLLAFYEATANVSFMQREAAGKTAAREESK